MYDVSELYKQSIKQTDRDIEVKIVVNGTTLYTNVEIVDLELEDSLTLSGKFELGSVIPSKLTFSIRGKDINIPENALIEPYILSAGGLSWEYADFTWSETELSWIHSSEFMPLGKFYIDERIFDNLNTWKFTCYDKLRLAQQPYVSDLTMPATMQTVLEEISFKLDIPIEPGTLVKHSVQLMPTELTIQQVLSYIASANSACIKLNKDGQIKFIYFNEDNKVDEHLKMSDYFKTTQTNPLKTFTKVVVHQNDQGDLSTLEKGIGSADNTISFVNPFVNESILDDIYTEINNFAYIPFTMDWKCLPYVEVGDVIEIDQSKGSSWLETDTAWADTDVTWDYDIVAFKTIILNNKITYKGGLKATSEAQSESAQKSEFKFKGTLTQYVENIDRTALKEGKPYNGVKTSREHGVVIERSDGKAKTVMNATEGISIYSGLGLERNFYVDLNGRIKAKEIDIDGSGTFGGTVKADQIDVTTGKITTAQIEDLIVGGNVTMGPNAVIRWGQVENADNIVTTITEDTLMTTNVFARYLEVRSANIIGTITADSLSTNAEINVGTDAYIGDYLFLGGGGSSGFYKKGIELVYGGSNTCSIEVDRYGDMSIFSWGNIDIKGSGLNLDAGVENVLIEGKNVELWCATNGSVVLTGRTILDDETFVGYQSQNNYVSTYSETGNSLSYNATTKQLRLLDVNGNVLSSVTL